jgi:hypothetical protein
MHYLIWGIGSSPAITAALESSTPVPLSPTQHCSVPLVSPPRQSRSAVPLSTAQLVSSRLASQSQHTRVIHCLLTSIGI